ncbi:MAG: hypothetical protein ACI4QL_00210 [Candidatus Fimimonas sp.]
MSTKFFNVEYPQGIQYEKHSEKFSDVTKITLQFTALCDVLLQQDEIKAGYCGEVGKSLILTHQLSVSRTALPFAFPATAALRNDGKGTFWVADYFQTSLPLRFALNNAEQGQVALVNEETHLKKGDKLRCVMYYGECNADSLFDLIGKCADALFEFLPYWQKEFEGFSGQNVSSYKQASLGLVSNLMDKRAIVRDGTGTFNPYAYHEIGAYSESFACMDVAKGFYRFAASNGLDGPLDYVRNQIRRLCNTDAQHPWIADCHNTKGFFHFAWGAIPQDSGVDANIKRDDLFSDYCGHEEGENLLSTFKYFDRVNLLGEMALVEGDDVIKQGFLKVLPFAESLRNDDFSQPVTYDLDSHLPVTGNSDGGSAGGEALYALIQFNAYRLTNQTYHLDFALKSLEVANKLDFDRMFSMRCAPKPVAIGALVRANVYAYEITGKENYLKRAQKVAKGIFAFYYLNPHPYCFFSSMGFGYACAQERWEAFREMEETLWLALPFLKYCNDPSLFKLYALNKQNALSALPINGNPYGNMQREYESFGGEYVPFEFSTGHIGDNPGLCGGSQSDKRQIKEIYGSGELFLAEMMYENYCRCYNPRVTVINLDCCDNLPQSDFSFAVFNVGEKAQTAILDFHLPQGTYKLSFNGEEWQFSSQTLALGVKLNVRAGLSSLTLRKQNHCCDVVCQKQNQTPVALQMLDEITLQWQGNCDFYVVADKTELSTTLHKTAETCVTFNFDSELKHTISVTGVCKNKIVQYRDTEISALKKQIRREFDFENMCGLTCNGFDCVSDGHSLMFYRSNLASNSAEAVFELGNAEQGELLELQIGAVNNGTTYDVKLLCDGKEKIVAKNLSSAKYLVVPVGNCGESKVAICAKTTAGLGLSVLKPGLLRANETAKSVVLPLQKESNGVRAVCSNYNYRYAVVAVGDMAKSTEFTILVDGVAAYNNTERKFLSKVDRKNRGVFKIPLPQNAQVIEVLTNCPTENFVKAIRLTQSCCYPVFTHYFDKEDVRSFYDD